MGKSCSKKMSTGYRKCDCGTIQEHHYDSQGGYWTPIPKCEEDIMNDNVIKYKDCYILTQESEE